MGSLKLMHLKNCTQIKKKWGRELIIYNDEYCGKLLEIRKGEKNSLHRHKNKKETFLVNKGMVELIYIENENTEHHVVLRVGSFITLPPMTWHYMKAYMDSVIIEFSTKHEEEDVERK